MWIERHENKQGFIINIFKNGGENGAQKITISKGKDWEGWKKMVDNLWSSVNGEKSNGRVFERLKWLERKIGQQQSYGECVEFG